MDIGPDEVIKLVEDPVNDLDQQMSLLVLQCGGHEQRQDLVEEGIRTKLPRLVRDGTQGRLRREEREGEREEREGEREEREGGKRGREGGKRGREGGERGREEGEREGRERER